ncbi:hypothetical protein ACJZ2D_014082 [Fusarium nematophilum]
MNGDTPSGTADGALHAGCWHDLLEGLQGVEDLEFDFDFLDACGAMDDANFEYNAWPGLAGENEPCQPHPALYSPDMTLADMSTIPGMGGSLFLDNYLDFDANLTDSNQGCSPLSSIPASSPEAPTYYSLPLGSVPYSLSVSPSLSLPSLLPVDPLLIVDPLLHSPVLSPAPSLPPESTTRTQLSPLPNKKPSKTTVKVAHRSPRYADPLTWVQTTYSVIAKKAARGATTPSLRGVRIATRAIRFPGS